MLKRLFTIVLASFILFSTAAVSAQKKSEQFTQFTSNIYSKWGDFETDKQFEMASTRQDDKTPVDKRTELTHILGGADGSEKAIQIQVVAPAEEDHLTFPFRSASNEMYQVSFFLKYDSADAKNVCIDFQHRKRENLVTLPLQGDGKEWVKYTFEWESKPHYQGTMHGGVTDMYIYLDGTEGYSFCLDRLSVLPYGYVDFDYSKVNFHYDYEESEETENKGRIKFDDITSHWARPVIVSLTNAGIVNGKDNSTYAPDASVTRAEFIKLVFGTLNKEETAYDKRFEDVSENDWYADVLASADNVGLIAMELKKDDKINPESAITREEAATIASAAAKILGGDNSKDVTFTDEDDISEWARTAVEGAASYGIISGYDDGSFKPHGTITRAEAAQMIHNLVEITGRLSIFVDSEKGSDKNDGTVSSPLASIEAARDMAAKYAPKMSNDITILIRGEQYLEETFTLSDKDSGQNGHDIIYTSWDDERAVITMAKTFTGFELHDAEKNIYKTFVGKGTYSRQAFFNDIRGIRSRTVGYLKNCDFMYPTYYVCDNMELLDVEYPNEVDAVFHTLWINAKMMVESFVEENGRVRINMHEFFDTNQGRIIHDGDANNRRQTPSWLENSYQFLDEKGEWYLNRHDGYMYYIPRDGEDIETLECKIPIGEEMIIAQGSSYGKPLCNVTFDNLIFEGATWLFPDRSGGFNSLQNGYFGGYSTFYVTNDGRKDGESPGAAIHFEKCNNITISNNVIREMGMIGLEFVDGSNHIDIVGNEFYDISGSAFLIDEASGGGYVRDEEAYVEYVDINNNYIHHVAQDYEGCSAVAFAWPRHSTFSHNEISYSPYSGLHIGWGWIAYEQTGSLLYDFEVSNNYVHDIMTQRVNDGSAFYSVGASSFECDTAADAKNEGANKNRILNNYFVNGWNCDLVYPDQESSSWYVANNVSDTGKHRAYASFNYDRTKGTPDNNSWTHMHASSIKWITYENNYANCGPHKTMMNQTESMIEMAHVYPDRDWPQEALDIIANAGITDEYKSNFKTDGPEIFISNNSWQTIQAGEPADSGLMVLGDDNEKFPLSDFDIEFWCDTPGAVTMDENGMVTAHEAGLFECEAFVVIDDVMMHQHFMFEVLGEIEEVRFDQSQMNILVGFSADVPIMGYMASGKGEDITGLPELEVNVASQDESIAVFKFDETRNKYAVTAVSKGDTRITGTIVYRGKSHKIDVPVSVITHGNPEAAKLPYREIDFTDGWTYDEAGKFEGGFKADAMPSHNASRMVTNELVAFDMEIDPGSAWPSIAFCDTDIMSDYSTEDCYMIGFKEDHIEFQRWNKGERTMIFGESVSSAGNNYTAVGGPGVPNTEDNKVVEYNKRYSIIMGALDTEEGTRIILTINGKNVLDYLDTSEKSITARGYFATYNPAPGGMIFYPFTNQQD